MALSPNEVMDEYTEALREMNNHNAQAMLSRRPSEVEAWRLRAPAIANRVKRARAMIDEMDSVL
jgi:hypothetical protein